MSVCLSGTVYIWLPRLRTIPSSTRMHAKRPPSKPEKICIFVISNSKSFIFQILKVVGPLGGNFDFFSPSGFEFESDFDYNTSKMKFQSFRVLKRYLNEKRLIRGREAATVSKFGELIFETYCVVRVKIEVSTTWRGRKSDVVFFKPLPMVTENP